MTNSKINQNRSFISYIILVYKILFFIKKKLCYNLYISKVWWKTRWTKNTTLFVYRTRGIKIWRKSKNLSRKVVKFNFLNFESLKKSFE